MGRHWDGGPNWPWIWAGSVYFALVFAVAFGLGMVRNLVLVPWLGALVAVALEVPLLLGVSWSAAGFVIRRFDVLPGWPRVAMGGVASGVLMGVEMGMTVALGGTVTGWIASLGSPGGVLGLGGQMVFGAIPALRMRGVFY